MSAYRALQRRLEDMRMRRRQHTSPVGAGRRSTRETHRYKFQHNLKAQASPPCLSFALVLEGAKAKLQVGRGLVFMVVLKFVPMGFPYASFPPAEPTGVAG